MSSQPIKILLTSADRTLLRRTSEFLVACGFDVKEAVSESQAQRVMLGFSPHILLVDSALEHSIHLLQNRTNNLRNDDPAPFAFLLVEDRTADKVLEALTCGSDDILPKPVCFTEMLVRIRAAVRFLEMEHRLTQRVGRISNTGLGKTGLFLRTLEKSLHEANAEDHRLSAGILELDHIDSLQIELGDSHAANLYKQFTHWLLERLSPDSQVFQLQNKKLGILLNKTSHDAAYQWIETLRQDLEKHAFTVNHQEVAVTLSAGIVSLETSSTSFDQLLDVATSRLQFAQRSGRNMVAYEKNIEAETLADSKSASPETLFEGTQAADVMRPCTMTVLPEETLGPVVNKMRAAQSLVIPVVDSNYKLQGVLVDDPAMDIDYENQQLVAERLQTNYPKQAIQARFDELIQFFAEHDEPWIVIHENDSPVGVVLRSDLALLSEPINRDLYKDNPQNEDPARFFAVAEPTPTA